jgi:phospholipase/carboxylesterase
MRAGVMAAASLLGPFIDAELVRLELPDDAYALMGFSQGAMTALYAGLRRHIPPRGILAFSGALIDPDGTPARADAPPVLIVHGEQDDVLPVGRSREAESRLNALGVAVESLYPPRLEHAIDATGLAFGSLFLQRIFAG